MVPSRWFSREGPFVEARYALEIAFVQLRRRAAEQQSGLKKRLSSPMPTTGMLFAVFLWHADTRTRAKKQGAARSQ
jgi:hypothetical protein